MSAGCEVLPFETPAALAAAAAEQWLAQLESVTGKQHFVALSGGRITIQFFAQIVDRAQPRRHLLDPVEFFWADERCVPPSDPESNFKLAQEHLFNPLGIASRQIHRIRGERTKEAAAAEAEEEIRQRVPLNSDGQPVLDVVFLGMGEDGHVASLFPGTMPELPATQATYRPVIGPKPPPARVTLTYAALTAARAVWVLASGAGKEDALRNSLVSNSITPLGQVLKLRQGARIFSDIPR